MKITNEKYLDLLNILDNFKDGDISSDDTLDQILGTLRIGVKEKRNDGIPLNSVIQNENITGVITRTKVGTSTVHVQEEAHSLHFKDILRDLSLEYPKSDGVFKEESITIVFSDETGPKEKISFFLDKYLGIRKMLNESEKP